MSPPKWSTRSVSKVQTLLDRLDKVRREREGQWNACCPAHQDRSPSLAVGETEDGRVLVHCHGGCSVDDVLAAVGLDMTDLYPDTTKTSYPSLMQHIHTRPKHLEHDDRVMSHALESGRKLTAEEKRRAEQSLRKGAKSDGAVAGIRREASKPLPSQTLTSVDSEADYNALMTEVNWYLDNPR